MGAFLEGGEYQGLDLLGRFSALPNEFASLRMDLDFLNLASITLDGSNNIQTILDATSQDRDFTQATASLRPAFVAGVGAQFVDDHLEHSANLITDTTGTVMAVVRFDRANNIERFLSQGNTAVADGDSISFFKSASNLSGKSFLAIGNATMTGDLPITDTTTFRVITIQKRTLYINSMEQNLILTGVSPLERWFNNTLPLGANRMYIGGLVRSAPIAYSRITLKRLSYFNTELSNQDVIKLVNGLRILYNF